MNESILKSKLSKSALNIGAGSPTDAGLSFTGSKLSNEKNIISKYGFIYKLENGLITISNDIS